MSADYETHGSAGTDYERRGKRWAAIAMTVWLAGIPPSIIWTRPIWPGAQLYAWWIVLLPVWGTCAVAAVFGIVMFYAWAFSRPPHAETEARIAALERELDIR